MKRLIALVVSMVAALQAALSQNAVKSLDSCVDYALVHNCDILLGKSALERSREDLLQSKLELLPSLNLYVNQYYNWGRSVDMQELVIVRNRLTRQTSGSVGASLPLFDGFQRFFNIAANRQRVSAALENVQQRILDVKADVAGAYLAEILARMTITRLEQSLENASGQLESVRTQISAGARNRSDALELEAHREDIVSRLEAARCEEAVQMVQLRSLMGCEELFLTDTCLEPAAFPPPDFYRGDINDLQAPSVAEAQSNVAAAKYALKAARGALMPTLSVSAAYGTYYSDASPSPFKEQVDGNQNPSVALSLSVPIFNGGKAAAQVARCIAELRESNIRLNQEKQRSQQYRKRLKEEAGSLYAQMSACTAKRDFCRERLREATAGHALGTVTTSEWIDSSEAFSQAECECLQCRCKYLFQLKLIEYYRDGCR